MRINKLIAALLLVIFSNITLSESFYNNLSAEENIVADLLIASSNPVKIKIGAKILHSQTKPRTDFLDIAAFKVTETQAVDVDAASWLIKAIGNSSRKRYLNFLNDTLQENADNRKLVKYLKQAIANIETSENEVMFDINAFDKKGLFQNYKKTDTNIIFEENHIEKANAGDSLNDVYEKLGHPSEISSWSKVKRFGAGPWGKSVRIENFKLIYSNSGYITFDSIGGLFIAQEVINFKSKFGLGSADIYADLGKTLLSADGVESQVIAKRLIRERRYQEAYFDSAAEKLWIEKNSADPYMINAIAHLVRYIGNGKNPRYTSFVKRVIDETKHNKLRKHAKKALKGLPKDIEGVTQYTP